MRATCGKLTAWGRPHVVADIGLRRLRGQLDRSVYDGRHPVTLRLATEPRELADPHRWQDLPIGRVGLAADCHKVLGAHDAPHAKCWGWAACAIVVGGGHWDEGGRAEIASKR